VGFDKQLTTNQLLSPAGCECSFGINAMNDSGKAVAVGTPDPARFSFQDAMRGWMKSEVGRLEGAFPA